MSLATEAGTVTDGHVGLPNVHVDVLEGMVMPSLSVGTGCDAEAEAEAEKAVDKLMLPTMLAELDEACSGIIGSAHVRVEVKPPHDDPEFYTLLTERGLQWRTAIVGDEGGYGECKWKGAGSAGPGVSGSVAFDINLGGSDMSSGARSGALGAGPSEGTSRALHMF